MFVGAEVDLIEDIAKSWADRVTSPSDGKRVRVGWTVVDPVRKDIVYTVCKTCRCIGTSFDLDVSNIVTRTIR